MSRQRRRFTPEQKSAILREHLLDKVAVADLCDKHDIKPTVFYSWQRTMFENLGSLFKRKGDSRSAALERKNEALRKKIASKDEVIAEIMEDYVAVKKTLGAD